MKLIDLLKVLKTRFILNSPYQLLHLITSKCNCKCDICNLWKRSSEYKNDLTTKEIIEMLNDAKKAGIVFYSVLGGEPLLRDDLKVILKYAKEIGMTTAVVTNGYNLKEKCREIYPFIDLLVVSIDSNDDLHDEMRRCKGLREKAIEGIKECKKSKMKITINSIINNRNLSKIDGLVNLARELKVNISFQPMDNIRGYNEHLQPSYGELQAAFKKIIEYKKKDFPVINSFEYLKIFSERKKYTCYAPRCFINVEANGDISSCLHVYNKKWGNTRSSSMKDIFQSKEYRIYCKNVKNCNECNVACVIESSLLYVLNPKILIEKAFSYRSTI